MIIERIKHFFGKHKYFKINKVSQFSHLLGCRYCDKKFIYDTEEIAVYDWNPGLEEFYKKQIETKKEITWKNRTMRKL